MSASAATVAETRQTWVRRARVVFALYLAVVVLVLLNPSATAPTTVVHWISQHALARGVPIQLAHPARVEFIGNVMAFAPLAFLAAWLWPHRSWHRWTAWGFAASFGIEVFQGVFLDGRSAAHADIVANTLGALLGSVAMLAITRAARHGLLPPWLLPPSTPPARSP